MAKKSGKWNIVFLISIIVLNIYALFYVYKWKDGDACVCAQDTKLHIIQYYLIFSILACIGQLIWIWKYAHMSASFYGLLFLLSGIYTYITYVYTQELVQKKCTCIEPLYIKVMYYISILSTFLYSTAGFFLAIALVAYWALKRKS